MTGNTVSRVTLTIGAIASNLEATTHGQREHTDPSRFKFEPVLNATLNSTYNLDRLTILVMTAAANIAIIDKNKSRLSSVIAIDVKTCLTLIMAKNDILAALAATEDGILGLRNNFYFARDYFLAIRSNDHTQNEAYQELTQYIDSNNICG